MMTRLKKAIAEWVRDANAEELKLAIDYIKECKAKHAVNELQMQKHDTTDTRHQEVLDSLLDMHLKMAKTQECIVQTQKQMGESQLESNKSQQALAESIKTLSKSFSKHEPTLDTVEKISLGLTGIKNSVGWLATVIGGLGVILGGVIAFIIFFSTGHLIMPVQ